MSQSVPGFPRLTIEQDKLGGQPCIRGHRFGAEQLLEMLADGMTYEESARITPSSNWRTFKKSSGTRQPDLVR
ncbi:MAG: DUF433 domain-containing protein [Propionibacterium sp.]|nr:DUF433 domain-containing protein [Propionibacterium sp.]